VQTPTLSVPDDPTALVEQLSGALTAVADLDQAPAMAAYLKDRFVLFGVKTPIRRKIAKPYVDAFRGAPEHVVPFAHACYARDERELHYVAVDTLRRWQRHLGPQHLEDLRVLLTTHSWWDTVDSLAAHPVGHLVKRHPELVATMDAWIDDENLWLARTAILHQLTYKADTDEERLFRYVLARADSTEFFLRKAQGWALRTYARVNADAVRRFVAEHEDRLSGLTRREATKHLR